MPNPLCHFEIMTNQPEQSRKFYASIFDWKFDDASMPGYTIISPGAEPNGGLFQAPPGTPGPCMNVYFMVIDVDGTLAKAVKGGATTLVPASDIPNVGRYALLADPEGIVFGLFKPAHE